MCDGLNHGAILVCRKRASAYEWSIVQLSLSQSGAAASEYATWGTINRVLEMPYRLLGHNRTCRWELSRILSSRACLFRTRQIYG